MGVRIMIGGGSGGYQGHVPPLGNLHTSCAPLQIAIPQYVCTRSGIRVLASHARGISYCMFQRVDRVSVLHCEALKMSFVGQIVL